MRIVCFACGLMSGSWCPVRKVRASFPPLTTYHLPLAYRCADRTVRTYRFPDLTPQFVLGAHRAAVNAVSISPTLIVSGSGDRSIKLWDAQNGQLLRTFENHHTRGCVHHNHPLFYFILVLYTVLHRSTLKPRMCSLDLRTSTSVSSTSRPSKVGRLHLILSIAHRRRLRLFLWRSVGMRLTRIQGERCVERVGVRMVVVVAAPVVVAVVLMGERGTRTRVGVLVLVLVLVSGGDVGTTKRAYTRT